MTRIRQAAVIGAGTMGAAIAAHLVNCGIPCLLLDIVPKDADPQNRSVIASGAIERLQKSKPAALYDNADADLLRPGNLEDDFEALRDVDWVIEAVPEILSIKQDLFKRLADIHHAGQLISSNTSGIALADIIADCPASFQSHVFICHFFNPPRYMYLLELVKGGKTDTTLFNDFISFAEHSLGKGVVVAKDTPNFIANRIGAFDMGMALQLMQELSIRVEDVDALAGPLIGRPKSGICRLLDMVGIDVISHVNANIYNGAPDDESRAIFAENPLIQGMISKGALGDKTGSGFYRKSKDAKGKRVIEALDLAKQDYAPIQPTDSSLLTDAKKIREIGERIRFLIDGNDPFNEFLWKLLSGTLCYAANRVPEISDSIQDIDNAMCWGFNWDIGPFALWDAIGVDLIVKRLQQESRSIPALVQDLIDSGADSFYKKDSKQSFDAVSKQFSILSTHSHNIDMEELRASSSVKAGKNCTSLNLGDGILGVYIHSPNNTLSIDVLAAIRDGITLAEEKYNGLVLCSRGANFSFGANLKEMMDVVTDKGISAVTSMIENFQKTSMMLKHSCIPTVAAPQGMALGGGCEFVMHCDRVQTGAELYMGLVEAGVGILPAGAGTKEYAVRASDWAGDTGNSLFPKINQAMELIGMAQTSTSGRDAQLKQYLRVTDQISMNKSFIVYDAKQHALQLANQHYRPPVARPVRVMGRSGISEYQVRLHNMREAGYISEHDQVVMNKIAYVMSGGDIPDNSMVSHQHLLDLEREAFLSLLGTEKTQARITHTMKTGKPLRN